MLHLNITMSGLDEVAKSLGDLKNTLEDFTPEMEAIGSSMKDYFSDTVFETEGDILGERWEPLSTTYDDWKNKNYPGRGVLERTGDLRRGFEVVPTSTYCIIRNNVDYGIFHNSDEPREKLPQRVFFKITEEYATELRTIIIDSLNDRVKNIM